MSNSKADIITRLRADILSMQGCKKILHTERKDFGLGKIVDAFPDNKFPIGAIHEFIYSNPENSAATNGFITGIIGLMMNDESMTVWIGPSFKIFPPALKAFNIPPERIIFIYLNKEKEILWATEEILKCEGVTAVIAELHNLSLINSRRLQLAVEKSLTTGFIVRNNSQSLNTTTCIARWKISSLPSVLNNNMPGVGFPRWNVELLKARNGKPGVWQVEWKAGQFRHINQIRVIHEQTRVKTG